MWVLLHGRGAGFLADGAGGGVSISFLDRGGWRAAFSRCCSFSAWRAAELGSGWSRAHWAQIGAFVALVYLFALLGSASRGHPAGEGASRTRTTSMLSAWARCRFHRRCSIGATRYARRTHCLNRNSICGSRDRESSDTFPIRRRINYIAKALEMPNVRLYLSFARFPSIQSFRDGDQHVVELGENRFQDGRRRGPQPFTYEVIFDADGRLAEEGWLTNGMLQSRIAAVDSANQQPRGRMRRLNLRESSDLQRHSWRRARARANRGATGGRLHLRGRSGDIRQGP